jgi:LytS/YehU family sensor histidine kinase
MQLRPHFLFNTLNSISALLRKDPDAADEMVGCLGDFLRMTLENSGQQKVKLQDELEFLNRYLEIERIRFQSRLLTQMQIEPQTLAALVPNLVLQPIVENAIRHGIAPNENQGRIDVRAWRTSGKLLLEVQDNGPGLPTGENAITVKDGIGLRNTRARLQQLYGATHRFAVDNVAEGGLKVTIEIPFTTSMAAVEGDEENFAHEPLC